MTEPTPPALPVSAPRISPRRSERNTRIVAWAGRLAERPGVKRGMAA